MPTIALSESALSLFRGYTGEIQVDGSNREACRELATEGLLIVGHDFTRGREAFYALTELGFKLRRALERDGWEFATATSPSGCASPHS